MHKKGDAISFAAAAFDGFYCKKSLEPDRIRPSLIFKRSPVTPALPTNRLISFLCLSYRQPNTFPKLEEYKSATDGKRTSTAATNV
jgi:hypothetical protein